MNQYWHGDLFWRTSSREAPHNVYTSTEEMKSYLEDRREAKKAPKLLYGIWSFKDLEKSEAENPKGLKLSFFPPAYVVSWEYDKDSGRYKRFQRNRLDKTLKGSQIFADNIAVAITDVETIDSVGRKKVDTIGRGKSYVFQDGVVIEGNWRKKSESERLRFFDDEGEEIVFNAGVTWIEVVPGESSMEIK